jgi:DNA-binding SARP family transcriptional activator
MRPSPIGVTFGPRYSVEFRILGPVEVVSDGRVIALGSLKPRALLVILLLHANEVVSRERLIDDLWGDQPPETAAASLHTYVSQLRKLVEANSGEPKLLVTRAPGYVLRVDPEHVDLKQFELLARRGKSELIAGDANTAASTLAAALALWRGPPLQEFGSAPFALAESLRLQELRISVYEDRIDADLALGGHDRLVGELDALVAENPYRERLCGQLMLALYRCGRQADALDVYRRTRRRLADELGLEPGPALQELEQAILRHQPTLSSRASPAVAGPERRRADRSASSIPVPPERARKPVLRRRWALIAVGAAVAAAAAAAVIAAHGRSSSIKPVAVKAHSVAVIDPARNAVVADIPTGAYPGPLAADSTYVYVANIGDYTVSRILPMKRKRYDTFALSPAIDMVAGDRQLWVANGGAPGHTPLGLGPGTVAVRNPGPTVKTFRVGPNINGGEEQTTIAADDSGYSLWAGNQDSRTVRQIDRTTDKTLITIHSIAPGGLAVVGNSSAGDTVWVSDPFRGLVARIDERARRIVAQIHIPGTPTRLAADARAVWVVARDRNGPGEWRPTRDTHPALWRIDPTTNKPITRIPVPLTPLRIALGGGYVWVTAQRVLSTQGNSVDATVFKIDPTTNRIVARIPLRTHAVDGIIVNHGLVWAAVPASQ